MKRVLNSLLFVLLIGLSLTTNSYKEVKADGDEPFNIEIADENNLAKWQYDWNTVAIGAGKTSFETGNLRMENINTSTSNYALYQTNKFCEFRLDMYANLFLPSPSDFGIDGNDWANLYVTFFIDYEDAKEVENVAQAACPWTYNKGWLSVCFERIAHSSRVQTLINETFDNNGGARFYLNPGGCTVSTIDWCDDEYHWYTITVEAVKSKNPSRPRPEEQGTIVTTYIDGVKQTEYFQSEVYYSNTKNQEETIPFSSQKGYVGFWASSSFPADKNTENTGVSIDIQKLQITSYDDVENKEDARPYTLCAKPDVRLEPALFTPEAYYETDEEMEIKLTELFDYDGDNKLTYTATVKGESFGTIRNGYFVWTPEKAGTYTVHFTATDGDKTAENDVRFRVQDPEVDPYKTTAGNNDEPTSAPTNATTTNNEEVEVTTQAKKQGCNSTLSLSMIFALPILGVAFAIRRRKVK